MKEAVDHLKQNDAILAAIIDRVGPPKLAYREASFEALARAIVSQQLSTKAASTIYGRLAEAVGGQMKPEAIQQLTVGEMRRAGLSKQKIGYIRDLAEHVLSGKVDFAKLHEMDDDEVIVTLTDIKGIGVWTVHMLLLFALRRPNVLPVGDLGVRIAIQRLYKKRKLPTAKEIHKIAKGWHPYCSFAAWYLWRSLEFADLRPKKRVKKPATKATKTHKPKTKANHKGHKGTRRK
jgi:DNA-3-methyladenine glycosylase II